MITIKKSPTADTRTCDYSTVSKETLLFSSQQHIGDVYRGLEYFRNKLLEASKNHDHDKISGIDHFYEDFKTGFNQTGWWDNHRRVNRHHINSDDGLPVDVNLIDVLEYIADCVMAGMARSGSVYNLQISGELLQKAFLNTVKDLMSKVVVE